MTALEQVQALVPVWVRFTPAPAAIAVSFALSWLLARACVWAAWGRRPPVLDGLHWTERARLTWPARVSLSQLSTIVPLGVAIAAFELPYALSAVPALVPRILAPLASLAAISLVYDREVQRARKRAAGFALTARTLSERWLIWYPHVLLIAIAALAMPAEFSATTYLAMAATAMGLVALHFGAAIHVARVLGLIRPASPRAVEAVARVAGALGMAPPGVYELRSDIGSAAALPWARAVLISSRALALLDGHQLDAVIAHELGHVSESRGVRLARLAGTLLLSPLTLLRPVAASFSFALAVMMVVAVVIALLPMQRLRRRLEERADGLAVETSESAGVYASALLRLYVDAEIPAVLGYTAVHPELYDRLLAAGLTPGFARPAPPPKRGQRIPGMVIGVAVATWILGAPSTYADLPFLPHGAHTREWLPIALTGGTAEELVELATVRSLAGEHAEAEVFYRAALELRDEWAYRFSLASALAARGDCDQARAELEIAIAQARHAGRSLFGRPIDDYAGSERMGQLHPLRRSLDAQCARAPADSAASSSSKP